MAMPLNEIEKERKGTNRRYKLDVGLLLFAPLKDAKDSVQRLL
jgi:hypothetical protein